MTDSSKSESDPAEAEMGFFEHLGELRKRLLMTAVYILCGGIAIYQFSETFFSILARPYVDAFPEAQLIGTGPAEAFLLKLKVAFFGGAIITSPLILHQVWLFIAPGLYEHERKFAIPFILSTSLLFLGGVSFCYQAVLPIAFEFFQSQYQSIGVSPTIRISEHLAIVLKALIGFGIAFELPVLAFFLGRLGLITDQSLIGAGRYAIVLIFVLSATLTPPDVMTQFLMAGPLLVLYGISILVVRYSAKNRNLDDDFS